MNWFDSTLIAYLNGFSKISFTFDTAVHFLSDRHLFKGGVLMSILWSCWFWCDQSDRSERRHIISTLIGSFAALVVAKVVAFMLPYRPRPLHETGLDFVLPHGVTRTSLEDVTAFPSDHAVLFFALATGLLFVSRRAGLFALAYTAIFICVPRVYLGLHYPTDIVAGAIIGSGIAWLANVSLNRKVSGYFVDRAESKPALFYPLFFLVTYQTTVLFDDLRATVSLVFGLI